MTTERPGTLIEAAEFLVDRSEQLAEAARDVFELSNIDDLTSLRNRASMRRYGVEVCGQLESSFVVFSGDLNGFKKINDSFTHLAGDVVLKKIGQVLVEIVERVGGIAFHPSGDEFVIIAEANLAKQLSVNLSESMKSIAVSFGEHSLYSSACFGYSYTDEEADFDEVLKRADLAMQRAKEKGPGTVVEWTHEMRELEYKDARFRCPSCRTLIKVSVPVDRLEGALIKSCPHCDANILADL